jgi:lipoprotein NlpI
MGRPNDAINDLTVALESEPGLALAKRRRAQAHLLAGQFDAAILDLDSLPNQRISDSIWRFVAAKRTQAPDAYAQLQSAAKGTDPTVWPGALVDGLEGQVTIPVVFNEARRDPKEASARLTETHFILGQLALAAGDIELAKKSFAAALAFERYDLIEYQGSKIELERLDPN